MKAVLIEPSDTHNNNILADVVVETDSYQKDNLEEDLELFDFGKKKKKETKKKQFDLKEPNDSLHETTPNERPEMDDDIDLSMDFSTAKKKPRRKKLQEVLLEDETKDKHEETLENSQNFADIDRDYTYDELLTGIYDGLRVKNQTLHSNNKQKFVILSPQVIKIGTKKTSFVNFTEICRILHRQCQHLLDFILTELGTSGSMDGYNQLILRGRFQQKHIENVLRRYIKEYVVCRVCRSPDTILQKDTRLFFLQCESCGSRYCVANIKAGFLAATRRDKNRK